MVKHALIYTRVSRAPKGSPESSRGRQERLCREWCSGQGYEVAGVFSEVRPASDLRLRRPAFEDLLVEARRGHADAVVAWKVDRYVRQGIDFERLREVCATAGVLLRSATEHIDAVEPMALAHGRMLAMFAGFETDTKSIRLKSRALDRARAGTFPRQGVFGLSGDGKTVIEAEAALVQEAAQRVLAGETPKEIAADWTARGLRRRSDVEHTGPSLRRLLNSPGIWGARGHLGEVVTQDCWPAIIDPLTAAQVRNQLAASRRTRAPRRLLTGFLECGGCGCPMTGASNRGDENYRCPVRAGCGRVTMSAPLVEAALIGQVLSRIASRYPANHYRPWNQRTTSLAISALDRETGVVRAVNAAYFIRAEITRSEWVSLRSMVAFSSHQEIARLGFIAPRGLARSIAPRKLGEHWESLSLPTRREVIALELHRAAIVPTGDLLPGAPSRVRPSWLLPDPVGWVAPSAFDLAERALIAGPGRAVARPYERSEAQIRADGRPVTYDEAAMLLGVRTDSIQRLVWRGSLTNVTPRANKGRRGTIALSDVDRHARWRASRLAEDRPQGARYEALSAAGRDRYRDRVAIQRAALSRTGRTDRLVYSTREVAELLNMSTNTVLRWARAGTIPSVIIGGVRLFPKDTLQSWLNRQPHAVR